MGKEKRGEDEGCGARYIHIGCFGEVAKREQDYIEIVFLDWSKCQLLCEAFGGNNCGSGS